MEMANAKSTIKIPRRVRDDCDLIVFITCESIPFKTAIKIPNIAVAISATSTPFKITRPLVTVCAVASSC